MAYDDDWEREFADRINRWSVTRWAKRIADRLTPTGGERSPFAYAR